MCVGGDAGTKVSQGRRRFPGASLTVRVLSQQHPLQAVGGHGDLVLGLGVALRVGAAGRGALGRAQVVHQGQPVLAAEVHELDVAHARVKVHACKQKGGGEGRGGAVKPGDPVRVGEEAGRGEEGVNNSGKGERGLGHFL